MLSKEEKAYCRALEALRKKDYATADKELKICRGLYDDSRGFGIISEATRLLAYLRQKNEGKTKIELAIKEAADNGKETVICGQSHQEETC